MQLCSDWGCYMPAFEGHQRCYAHVLSQWRGRWAQLKTVEHYIQEVAAQTLVAKLDPLSKHRIHILASASGALLKLLLSSDGWLAKAIDEWKRGGTIEPFSCFNEHQP